MPEEKAAQSLIKYTQKGIKFQREEDAGKKLSKILTDDLMETILQNLRDNGKRGVIKCQK